MSADLPTWAKPEGRLRGPQPAHSRDGIAQAAVRIADSHGIEAVSMRRVAAEITSAATSLYRYVRNKEELLDLMIESAVGETIFPDPSNDWRVDLRTIAHQIRDRLKRHPWLISFSASRPALGPNSLAAMEAMLRALDRQGLQIDDMVLIANALSTLVRGYAADEIAEQQAELRSGLDHAQWMANQAQYVKFIRNSGRYPHFIRVIDDASVPHDPERARRGFDQALEYLLDGISSRLGSETSARA